MQSVTPKDKTVSMLKFERSPSHSWWWDSHNSPKHSKWLQSNLQDLDDKVKEMLRLIQEDADSFAQRAEMYYQKRPELINLVEEFYRAYRSLAERYDHLRGEIRQNIPQALQLQYGLSCDSPNRIDANKRRHHYSPLRQSNQMFENIPEKAGQIDYPPKLVDLVGDFKEKSMNNDHKVKEHDFNDDFVESSPNSSDKGELLLSSSDSEVDNFTPLEQLRLEMKELEDKNNSLVESQTKTLEINTFLESKMRDLEKGYRFKQEEVNDLQCKILELNEELARVSGFFDQKHNGLHGIEAHADKKGQETEPHVMTLSRLGGDDDLSKSFLNKCGQDDRSLEVESMHGQSVALFNSLQRELGVLKEENRVQKLVIIERGEEKREVIRQLSLSLEMLKNENQRLELALRLLRKRLHVRDAAAVCGVSHSPLTAWRQLFALVGFKTHQSFVAVAL